MCPKQSICSCFSVVVRSICESLFYFSISCRYSSIMVRNGKMDGIVISAIVNRRVLPQDAVVSTK